MKKKKVFTPKDPKKRAKGAIVGISVHLVTVAAMAAFTVINLSKLMGAKDADLIGGMAPGFEPFVLAYGLAAILYLLTLFPYLVLFLMWVHRANRNAQTLSKGMEVSPGWNVGWFFVPFASLYKPFQGLDQTWRVSTDPVGWRGLDAPMLLRWWWGFFLTGNITGSLSNLASKSMTAGGQTAGAVITIVCFASSLAAGVLAIRMIRRVTDLQVSALNAAAFT
jgi:hypothetical protein